jgi:uncharacterized protein (DUF1778 family)
MATVKRAHVRGQRGDKLPPLAQHPLSASSPERPVARTTAKHISTRITEHVLDRLQEAADLVGVTVNQFVVQAALEKAERIIENESQIVLTRKGSLWLLDLLDSPPPRNAKFKAAQTHYRSTVSNSDPSARL